MTEGTAALVEVLAWLGATYGATRVVFHAVPRKSLTWFSLVGVLIATFMGPCLARDADLGSFDLLFTTSLIVLYGVIPLRILKVPPA